MLSLPHSIRVCRTPYLCLVAALVHTRVDRTRQTDLDWMSQSYM